MVGYDPRRKQELTVGESAAAGAAAGIITRVACQPLDVIKIRFQLQVEPVNKYHAGAKYSGIVQAFSSVVKEEGPSALWKGHVPAQVLSVVYGMAQFTAFEILTKHMWKLAPQLQSDSWRPAVNFACGGTAGCIATVLSMPCDVLRTRLVAQGKVKVYRGIGNAVMQIYRTEGLTAFFKGLSPTLIQIAPHIGLQFGSYTFFTNATKNWMETESQDISGMCSLLCGSLAGVTAKSIVYPLDLMKKRLQIQGFEEARKPFGEVVKYHGLTDCLVKVAKREGFLAFFKGLSPSLCKAAVATGLHFCVYEQVCQIMMGPIVNQK